MARRTRWLWLIVLFLIQGLYFPINRLMEGGVVLRIPWDDFVPFWPIWMVPYLLSTMWWEASFIWAAWRMGAERYRALVIATIVVMLASYLVYVFYPTYVERPTLKGNSWPVALTRFVYRHDRLHNAFPSGHTYFTLLITFFWWDWRPQLRWLWGLIAVVVVLSTLFTGQHHLLDPVGGLVWAWGGYRLGTWWAARRMRG
jgi:membrane-associated phospholipid phosphatase